MIKLRLYQEKLYSNIKQVLAEYRRVIACMATGGGKTKTFVKIAQDAVKRGTTVLIITESRSIFSQIRDEVGECYEIAEGAGEMYIKKGVVYVAMAQTLVRRKLTLGQFAAMGKKLLIINDEAHVGTATKCLEQLPDAYLLGFTATPDYRKAKHLPKLYNQIVVGPQPAELIDERALSPYRHYERKGVDNSQLKIKNGEYSDESQNLVFMDPASVALLIRDMAHAPYRKAMIFCANILAAEFVGGLIRQSGLGGSIVHSKAPDADFQLWQFMEGGNDICVSVGSLTKGFDYPATDLIVLWRATTSLPLYLQMIGRGSRMCEGKDSFTVLDYGQNGSRHGRWDGVYDWGTMWRDVEKKKGVASSKVCENCLALLPASVIVCGECGYAFPVKESRPKESPKETILRELAEVSGIRVSLFTPEQLAKYSELEGKSGFCARVARTKGELFLAQYARIKGYKSGWVAHQDGLPKGFTDVVVNI